MNLTPPVDDVSKAKKMKVQFENLSMSTIERPVQQPFSNLLRIGEPHLGMQNSFTLPQNNINDQHDYPNALDNAPTNPFTNPFNTQPSLNQFLGI